MYERKENNKTVLRNLIKEKCNNFADPIYTLQE